MMCHSLDGPIQSGTTGYLNGRRQVCHVLQNYNLKTLLSIDNNTCSRSISTVPKLLHENNLQSDYVITASSMTYDMYVQKVLKVTCTQKSRMVGIPL